MRVGLQCCSSHTDACMVQRRHSPGCTRRPLGPQPTRKERPRRRPASTMHRCAPSDGCPESCTAVIAPSDIAKSAPGRLSVALPANAILGDIPQQTRPHTPKATHLWSVKSVNTCTKIGQPLYNSHYASSPDVVKFCCKGAQWTICIPVAVGGRNAGAGRRQDLAAGTAALGRVAGCGAGRSLGASKAGAGALAAA